MNALNNIGGNAATAGLRKALSDPSPAVKFGAAASLAARRISRRRRCLEIRVGQPSAHRSTDRGLKSLATLFRIDPVGTKLLTRDVDGLNPWIDPSAPISEDHITRHR